MRRIEPGSFDPAEFLPSAYRSVEELEGFFEHLVREVYDPALRAVVEAVVGASRSATELRRAPCTRGGHHAYLGGLLEHTVAVGTLVGEVCQLHPRLDSDLLMAAALLHDIGKTREFTYGAEFGISEEGAMLGHLAIGAELIGARAATSAPRRERLALLHCVLSHHGPEAAGRVRGGAGRRLQPPRGARAGSALNSLEAGVKGALEHGLALASVRARGACRLALGSGGASSQPPLLGRAARAGSGAGACAGAARRRAASAAARAPSRGCAPDRASPGRRRSPAGRAARRSAPSGRR